MSKKGGYQILDLENKPLVSGAGVTIKGIYEKIEGTTKRLVLSGLNLNGIEHRDMSCNAVLSGTNYLLHSSGVVNPVNGPIQIVITQDDLVTVTPIPDAAAVSVEDISGVNANSSATGNV